MKGYIYSIVCKSTGKRYVGKTIDKEERLYRHLFKLKNNAHPNEKLQSAYNKYGGEDFDTEIIEFDDISSEELDEQEIYYIKKYNSIKNGFNMTIGGTGGDTRSKLNYEEFCFAYFGNLKYDGMTNRTAKHLGVDSASIASIKRKESYAWFRKEADLLPSDEKAEWEDLFYKEMNIEENPPWVVQKTPDEDRTLRIMCVVSTYGRGAEGAILRKFDMSKGFIFHLMTGNGRKELKERYSNMSQKEIEEIGDKYFHEWNIQDYSKRTIRRVYNNLNERY